MEFVYFLLGISIGLIPMFITMIIITIVQLVRGKKWFGYLLVWASA